MLRRNAPNALVGSESTKTITLTGEFTLFDIPFFVQSHDIGMFGPGHMGRTPGGAGLCVPEDKAEEASELLRCAVRGEDEGAGEET